MRFLANERGKNGKLNQQIAAKDQEIADLKRKTQAAETQLYEWQNTALEATEAWNSWEFSCEEKDTEIADLKRQLEEANEEIRVSHEAIDLITDVNHKYVVSATTLTAELAEARKDIERLDWLERRRLALNAYYGTKYGWKFVTSSNVTRLFVGDVNTIDLNDAEANAGNIREAIDAAREGR